MTTMLHELGRNGQLRVAINTGNRALVQIENGELRGISPALARRLASEIEKRFEPVLYEGAGEVFADARKDTWDVAFLAIDATRAEVVGFTRPYVTIEATYAVRLNDAVNSVAELDAVGREIVLSNGSAYDMFLSGHLRRARIVRAQTPGASFSKFREGVGDAVAGVRETLAAAFDGDPGVRILPDSFSEVRQAMVLPSLDHPALEALDDFVRRAIDDGFVARSTGGG